MDKTMLRSDFFRNGERVLLVVVAGLLVLHQLYLLRAMPVAPYMDTLRVIALLDGWEQGRVALSQLWGVGSAHQGLVNEAFIYANIKLLHYDALWASRLTGVAIALSSLTLGLAGLFWLRREPEPSSLWRGLGCLLFCMLIPVLLFSGAGFELLTLDLGLSLWVKNAAIVMYFVLYSSFLRMDADSSMRWQGLLLMLLGPFLVMLVTMGWSFAFVGGATLQLLAAGRTGRYWLYRTLPVLLLWVALAVYVGISLSGASSGELAAAGVRLSELPRLVASALGAAVIPPETSARINLSISAQQAMGMLLMLAAVVILAVLASRRRRLSDTTPLALLAYAGATALALALGRGADGAAAMLASRYYMDLVLFPIGLMWLALMLGNAKKVRTLTAFLGISVFCFILLLQYFTYRYEWRAAPYRAAVFSAMNRALLQQVPDEQAAATLQAPLGDARAASRVMQEEKLGPFHEATSSADCDPGLLTRGRGWYDEENGGAWMAADAFLAVPGCPCKLSMDIYLPEDFPERVVTFATPDGRHEDVSVRPGVSTNVAVDLPLQKGLLSLRTNGTSQPARLGQSADTRELGVFVGPLAILCPSQEGM